MSDAFSGDWPDCSTLKSEARFASVVVKATAAADVLMSRSRGALMGSSRACPRTELIQSWP